MTPLGIGGAPSGFVCVAMPRSRRTMFCCRASQHHPIVQSMAEDPSPLTWRPLSADGFAAKAIPHSCCLASPSSFQLQIRALRLRSFRRISGSSHGRNSRSHSSSICTHSRRTNASTRNQGLSHNTLRCQPSTRGVGHRGFQGGLRAQPRQQQTAGFSCRCSTRPQGTWTGQRPNSETHAFLGVAWRQALQHLQCAPPIPVETTLRVLEVQQAAAVAEGRELTAPEIALPRVLQQASAYLPASASVFLTWAVERCTTPEGYIPATAQETLLLLFLGEGRAAQLVATADAFRASIDRPSNADRQARAPAGRQHQYQPVSAADALQSNAHVCMYVCM